jgi:multiple sugar transport system ATP-binding protein
MNMLSGDLEGDKLRLSMVELTLPEEVRSRLTGDIPKQVVVGIRPEHFQDAALVGEAAHQGATFKTKVDVVEWLGSELYVHFQVGQDTDVAELADVSDLRTVDVPGASGDVVARIDPASNLRKGEEAELWLDTRRLLLFDPASGRNLLHSGEA